MKPSIKPFTVSEVSSEGSLVQFTCIVLAGDDPVSLHWLKRDDDTTPLLTSRRNYDEILKSSGRLKRDTMHQSAYADFELLSPSHDSSKFQLNGKKIDSEKFDSRTVEFPLYFIPSSTSNCTHYLKSNSARKRTKRFSASTSLVKSNEVNPGDMSRHHKFIKIMKGHPSKGNNSRTKNHPFPVKLSNMKYMNTITPKMGYPPVSGRHPYFESSQSYSDASFGPSKSDFNIASLKKPKVPISVLHRDAIVVSPQSKLASSVITSDPDYGIIVHQISNKLSLLMIPDVRHEHSGHYTCRASNDIGVDEFTSHLLVQGTRMLPHTSSYNQKIP